MFPELFQGRKPTIGEFTPADTAKLLQRDNLEHRTDVIMKLIRYSCGGATGVSKQMDTRCAEKNREFVRKCVESNQGGDEAQTSATCGALGGGKGRCRVCHAHSARNTTECSSIATIDGKGMRCHHTHCLDFAE